MKGIRLGGLAAGLFAAGLLTGLAGTAIARDATATAQCDAHVAMSGFRHDMTGMMSMMGGGSMMGAPNASMGPDQMGGVGSGGPMPGGQHEAHHPQASSGTAE
jgi:hypothetical protein